LKKFFFFLFFFSIYIHSDENIVIVISMDGVRYDFPQLTNNGGFDLIELDGLKATSLVPVYQSSTFPAHISMATGVTPDKHGVLHNSFYDKTRGSYSYSADASWIEAEPVWSILERNNIKTATYFWVGSETDWNGTQISYSKAPFDGGVLEKDKTKKILEWIDLESDLRPRLIMSWWHGTDTISHKKGSLDPEVIQQLRKQDQELLNLINEITKRNIWDIVTLIIVSDHGISDVSNYINLKEILNINSIDARLSVGPAVGHIFLDNHDELKRSESILKKVPELTVWEKASLPSEYNMLHEQRTGDLIVTTDAPNMLVTWNSSNPPKGMHGYDPVDNIEMEGIFFALGNNVSNLKIEKVHQLDIAPTILNLLDVDIPNYMSGDIINLN
jgi:predicted AlkP superfamily pyrophosphatase or phosphodiesterase